jgi:hypothetical protein
MSYLIETYEISDSKELKIFQDSDVESPRDWDNLGTMICFHRRYNLGDEHNFDNPEEFRECVSDIAVILPLYLYDHSGITMSTTPFSCPWDSGQVGWIYVTKEEIRKNYGVKRISKKLLERVTNYLVSEVKTYDQYLTGEVYGFQLVEKSTCNCGAEHEEILDSCWGFYGTDWKENGILECLDSNDRAVVETQL